MKRILKENRKFLLYFLVIISFPFLFGCNGIDRTDPIIIFFEADTYAITEGESVNLSWKVSEATAVTIDPDIGLVDLSGSIVVSPNTTTTYTLTATNSCGQLFFPAIKTDKVIIEVIPAIAK